MQIGSFKLSTPMALVAGVGGLCIVCCGISLVTGALSEATRSPADKTATAVVKALPSATREPATARPAAATATPVTLIGLNQPVQAGDWNITLTDVERPGKTLVWSAFNNNSTAKGEWLVVRLDLVNKGTRNFSMNTFDWELLDGGGVKYDTSTDGASVGYATFKKLTRMGEQVPPNTPVQSMLLYDVAPGSAGFKLTLKATKTAFALP